MAKRTNAERFAADVQKILQEYGDSVKDNLDIVTKAVARKGAQAVKRAAGQFGGGGDYAKGWTATIEVSRLKVEAAIHNKRKPGLPHLLENGHALRNGGRAPGRVHIAPVEEQIVKEYENEVLSKI